MRWLLFLSRVAFLAGIFVILSFSTLIWDWEGQNSIISSIIFAGYTLGLLLIPLTCLVYLVVLVIKRKLNNYVPVWLVAANLVFLFLLMLHIFYFNDPYYNQ